MASKHVGMTAHASSAGRASGLFSQHRALDEPECVASSGSSCHPQCTVSSMKLRHFSEPAQENCGSEAMHQRYRRYMCNETTIDNLCETRFLECHTALVTFQQLFGFVAETMQEIKSWNSTSAMRSVSSVYASMHQFLNGTSAQLGYIVPFKLDVVKKI